MRELIHRCRCEAAPHNDPAFYRALRRRDDRGWSRVVCAVCRRFIGYRPPTDAILWPPDWLTPEPKPEQTP